MLDDLSAHVRELSNHISAPAKLLPEFGHSEGHGFHVEFSDGVFHLDDVDRGSEYRVLSSTDPAEMLYQIFRRMTSELRWPRDEYAKDPRRRQFATELNLLGKLSTDWQNRRRQEQCEELQERPFSDPGTAEERMRFWQFYHLSEDLSRVLGRPEVRQSHLRE